MPGALLVSFCAVLAAFSRGPMRPLTGSIPAITGRQEVVRFIASPEKHKPYVGLLTTPSGINILRDNVADHLHHHGLMLAFNVEGTNFWEETPGCGIQRVVSSRAAPRRISQTIAWVEPTTGRVLLEERRSIAVLRSPDPRATLLSWESRLSVPGSGSAKVSGAHYHGLGMRFVEAMDGGVFENAAADPGAVVRGEERLMAGRWCAYRAAANGRDLTVAAFDHPENIRSATWFTMPRPFGYLSATLRAHEMPLTIEAGRPLVLRYAVAAWDGHATSEEIQRLYLRWLGMGDLRVRSESEGSK